MPQNIHIIDRSDVITHVNTAWISFARENGIPEARGEDYEGRSIWDFIEDETTSQLWRLIFDKVRTGRKVLRLHYRCDSPDRRRYMLMGIFPLPYGQIEMVNRVLREETRRPVDFLDPLVSHTWGPLAVCSWCKKLRVSPALPERPECEDWTEIEEAIARLGLLDLPGLPSLSHTICIACKNTVLMELEQESGSQVVITLTAAEGSS